jgi:CDP-diglyceride synthetase
MNKEVDSSHGPADATEVRSDYELALRRIEHEHLLENNRLSWFLAFQGFLFAAIALGGKDGEATIAAFAKTMVPLTGAFVSFLAFCGVCASQCSRRAVKKWFNGKHAHTELPAMSPSKAGSWLGRVTAWLLPVVLMVAWFWLLMAGSPKLHHQAPPSVTPAIRGAASPTNAVRQ